LCSCLAKQPFRLHQEDGDRQRVDEKRAAVRPQIFAGRVDDAEDQGGDEGAANAAETAHGDHDQKENEIGEGEGRRHADDLDGQSAAERRQPAAECKRQDEQAVDIDSDGLGHAPVVDGGADPGADDRAFEPVPERRHHQETDNDSEGAVGGKGAETEIDLAGEEFRHGDTDRGRTVDKGDARRRHEHQADRQKHLIEFTGLVEPAIQEPFERHADDRDNERGQHQRGEKRDAGLQHQCDENVAAEHGEGAMGQIGETHQPHGDRQADGDDEQQHGIGHPVEQDRYRGLESLFHSNTSRISGIFIRPDAWNPTRGRTDPLGRLGSGGKESGKTAAVQPPPLLEIGVYLHLPMPLALHGSLTCGIVSITSTISRPSWDTILCTLESWMMSRVSGSMVILPRGLS